MGELGEITVAQIEARVAEVARLAETDNEAAHGEEDAIFVDLVQAIAEGRCIDPGACARAALLVCDLNYTRWYA